MDANEEYHDPDYVGSQVPVKQEEQTLTETEKVNKIKSIIDREFANELEIREKEIKLIDQRMSSARHLLHRLRYALVTKFYQDQKLMLSHSHIQDEIATQHEPKVKAEVSSILRDPQKRIHPSVRKLLGRRAVDLEEIFKYRPPRNKTRRNYSTMAQMKNVTTSADNTKTLRPDSNQELMTGNPQNEPATSKPKKVPRTIEPKLENVLTLDEITRNKQKHRYRIIIGNTSKYAPSSSRMDRSTHKWLLYVRGLEPGLAAIVTSVTARLHASYAPHHIVHVDKEPYHISRRGWGEFAAKVDLNFALPDRNPPASVEHTIKLDRNYTGLQTLGSETVVDVWLYSNEEMTKYEFKENSDASMDTPVKTEPEQNTQSDIETNKQIDNWLDYFNKDTELDVDEMLIKNIKKESIDISEDKVLQDVQVKNELVKKEIEDEISNDTANIPNEWLNNAQKKRIMQYMDPTTGKIYYLEIDNNLDLSKVQEIVINSKGTVKTAKISPIKTNGLKIQKKIKKGQSLLQPEVKKALKLDHSRKLLNKEKFRHIENDHCYLANPERKINLGEVKSEVESVKSEVNLYDKLVGSVRRINCVKVAVNYLLKQIPLISDKAGSGYLKNMPFVVSSEDRYWNLDFAKRRNIEWSRAKLVNTILKNNYAKPEQVWRTKQILLYSRHYLYCPLRDNNLETVTNDQEWSSVNDLEGKRSEFKAMFPLKTTVTVFDESRFVPNVKVTEVVSLTDDSEEIDVLCDNPVRVKSEVLPDSSKEDLQVLPVESEEDRMRFFFIERKCAEIGLELRNEDVGSGYCYSAVHAVLLSAMKNFAEELIRESVAASLTDNRFKHDPPSSVWSTPPETPISLSLSSTLEGAKRTRGHLVKEALGTQPKQTYLL